MTAGRRPGRLRAGTPVPVTAPPAAGGQPAQGEVLARLRVRVHAWAGRRDDVQLLGLDRFGVRYRVESPRGGYDVRVAFPEPLTGSEEFAGAVRGLLSCALDRRGRLGRAPPPRSRGGAPLRG